MTSRLLLFSGLFFLFFQTKAQIKISPDTMTAICPMTPTTFTVTVPATFGVTTLYIVDGHLNPIVGNNGASVYNTKPATVVTPPQSWLYNSNGTMTFSFVGQFTDNNAVQTFHVVTTDDGGGHFKAYYFDFFKIQSFNPGNNTYNQPSPAIDSFKAPICFTDPIGLSFLPVQYISEYPFTRYLYGTISQYQYLIPANWQLGTTVSDGSTWITSTDNVSITPDATGGVGQNIQVRALNSCNSSLTPGPIKSIPIERVQKQGTLVASDGTDYLCSGSKTYTVSGLPSGAAVTWALQTINNGPTIPANSTGTSVVITAGTQSWKGWLRATVTDCSGNSYVLPTYVRVGAPQGFLMSALTNVTNCPDEVNTFLINSNPGGLYAYQGGITVTDASLVGDSFNWGYLPGNGGATNGIYYAQGTGGQVTVEAKLASMTNGLQVNVGNECGNETQNYVFSSLSSCAQLATKTGSTLGSASTATDSTSGAVAGVYPNPIHDQLKVVLPAGIDFRNTTIMVFDGYGKQVRTVIASGTTTTIPVSSLTNGVYFVEIFKGSEMLFTKKILKQ